MSNINIKNFYTKLPEIENSIKDAKLISVDLEFTALHPLKTPSLFDSPNERYSKLRINLAQIIPIQVGITTFTFNPNDRSYHGKMYNFYILPACFPTIQRSFYFQSDTLNFLKLHKFDFNEWAINVTKYGRFDQDGIHIYYVFEKYTINILKIC
ncbi:poly(A)-specific ribonuclease PARN-like [Anoplophora glabripennis]|uniref:poly(A)-specific ribonuclease PARN-like n=1 Tax=Anoplophora glabripennis TaxID=217634 RepID=UPI00087493CE|nr:poly(A)-specific ribonuclease PARN-like [Anoplophora glabripennis]